MCILYGHNIREIFECGDVNLDGLDDYVFTYTKINPKDGDTTYVGIYYATSDTTFTLKEVYPNLYPIVFMRYDFEYRVKDSLLNEIQGMYNGNYPLNWINF